MTIDEAIEILQDIFDDKHFEGYPNYEDAVKLGKEALKHLKVSRDPSGVPPYNLLPGETKK